MSRKASKVGPFILGETVGRGATGVVRLAFHKDTGQEVAVKIIEKGALFQKPDMAAKLEREIAVMKLLRHPNVLTMFDVYENSEKLFLVLEYARSGELFDYLLTNGPLESQAALQIFQQIIEGLYYCHTRGVCHRDLKPENLLLDENNCIKIADFGMAAVSHPPKLFETSCGSPHYASPEVVCGKPYDGLKADVWSCGVILYAIVAGKLPFDDDNIRNLLAKVKCGEFTIPSFVKADIQDLIRRMLIVDPEERYSLSDVREHPWYQTLTPENPCDGVFEDTFEPIEEIDEEIVRSLVALSFEDRNTPAIVRSLKSDEPNLTKTFYNDLLKRKMNPNPIAQKNGKSIGRTTSEGHMKKSKLKPADDGSPTKTEEAPKRTLLRRMSIGANGFLKIPLFSLGNSSSSSSSSSSAEPTSPSSSAAPLTPHSPASSPSSSSSEPEEKHRKVPKIKLNSSLDEGKGKTVGTTPRRSWLPSIFGDNKIKVKDLKDGVHSSKRTQEITKELEESLDVMGAKFSFNSRSDEIKVSITRDAKPIKFDIAIVQTGENERGKPVYFISFTRKKGDKDAFREIYQRLVSMLNI